MTAGKPSWCAHTAHPFFWEHVTWPWRNYVHKAEKTRRHIKPCQNLFFFALHLRRDACGEWCDARLILLKRGLWCKLPLCWMSRLSEIFISAMAVVCWGAGTFFLKSVNQRYSLFFIFIVFMWIACIIKQFNPCEVKLSNTLIIIMLTWYETLYFLYFFLDFGCCDIVRWCKGCLFLVLKAV